MIKVSDRDKGNISASILSASDVINKKIDSLSVKLNNLMSLLIEKNNDLGKMLVEVDRLKGETKEIGEDAADFTGTQTCPGYSYGGLIGKIKEIERELDGIDTDITIEDYCTGGYQDHIDNPDQGPGCTEFGVCNVYSIDGCDSYCQGYGEYCSETFGGGEPGQSSPDDTPDTPTGCITSYTACESQYGIPGVGYCMSGYRNGSCDIFNAYPGAGEGIKCKASVRTELEVGLQDGTEQCEGGYEFGDGEHIAFCNSKYTVGEDGYTNCTEYGTGEMTCNRYGSDGKDTYCQPYCGGYDSATDTATGEYCGDFGVGSNGLTACQTTYETGDGKACKVIYGFQDDGETVCYSYGDAAGVECTIVGVKGDGHVTDCQTFSTTEASCTGFKSEDGGGGSCFSGFKNTDLECNSSFSYSGPGGTGMCDGFTDSNGHTTSGIIGGSCDRCYNNKYTYTDSSGNKIEVETKGDGTTTTTTTDSGGNTETEVTKPSGGADAVIDSLCPSGFRESCNPFGTAPDGHTCVGYTEGGGCLIYG